MVCPDCFVQMIQKDKVGGGKSEDTVYLTWMLLECPVCKTLICETYHAKVVSSKAEALSLPTD